ncbi:MAG: hypothetical protein C5B49_12935, partial [Bdellovibrio sp.]
MNRPWMVGRTIGAVPIFFSMNVLSSLNVHAQSVWGSGAYPAMPRCGQDTMLANNIINERDQIEGYQRRFNENEAKVSALKSEIDKHRHALSENQRKLHRDLEDLGLAGSYSDMERHILRGSRCDLLRTGRIRESSTTEPSESEKIAGAPDSGAAGSEAPKAAEAAAPSNTDAPSVESESAGGPSRAPASVAQEVIDNCQDGGRFDVAICKGDHNCETHLTRMIEAARKKRDAESELEGATEELEEARRLANFNDEQSARLKTQFEANARQYQTEGGCLQCLLSQRTTVEVHEAKPFWADLIVPVMGALTQGYIANQQMKTYQNVANNWSQMNALAGYNTPPPQMPLSSFGYGAMTAAGGLVGALQTALGNGGFGCSGGLFGSGFPMGPNGLAGAYGAMNPWGAYQTNPMQAGLFGFPQSMYPTPYGQGMFNPGMGMNFSLGLGGQAYCPAWPCPIGSGMGGIPGYPMGMGGGMLGGGGYMPGGFYGPPRIPMGVYPGGFQMPGGMPGGMPGFGPGGIGMTGGFYGGGFPG